MLKYIPVFEDAEKADEAADTERKIKYMRPIAHVVFNIAAQSEGVELPPLPRIDRDFNPIDRCEGIVAGYIDSPVVHHDGRGRAFYRHDKDTVHMPKRNTFESEADYYCTLFHELTHSTGHPKRLARSGITSHARFGSKIYAREELIAEMGASMLCGQAGIENQTIENNAAYIANWLTALKDDRTLIISASAQAIKAVRYMTNDQVIEIQQAA